MKERIWTELVVFVLVMVVITGLLYLVILPQTPILISFFLSFNFTTFFWMGKDKFSAGLPAQAGRGAERVPELFFYSVALLGGSLGVMAGIPFFHHKQSKSSFLAVIFVIVVIQFLLVMAFRGVLPH